MKKKHIIWGAVLGGLALGVALMLALVSVDTYSSTNDSCMRCHYHEEADRLWKQSDHYLNESGVVTDCAACHLPPKEDGVVRYYMVKLRMGAKDMWTKLVKDKEDIDWAAKRQVDYAPRIVYNASCVKCHENLYPEGISDDGIAAHLYYDENHEKLKLNCVSCHLNAGHYIEGYTHQKLQGKVDTGSGEIYTAPAAPERFESFTETVPGTNAAIRMVAVPGGEFLLGSPADEPRRGADEGPQKRVRISRFFMAETEITWRQFWSFYNETMSEGRTPPSVIYEANSRPGLDAVSGPTPPFGFPDQGWGMGERPAITMTHYAAETFCLWLSLKTGKTYRRRPQEVRSQGPPQPLRGGYDDDRPLRDLQRQLPVPDAGAPGGQGQSLRPQEHARQRDGILRRPLCRGRLRANHRRRPGPEGPGRGRGVRRPRRLVCR